MILPAEVKKHGIDLLYSPNNISPLVFNAKSALMIFDLHWFRFEKLFSFSKMAYIKNMITLSAKRADVILTLSESSKKDICGLLNIKPEKIFITYSGAFDSTDDHENDNIIKQELPEKYILFIGQFHKRKNIPALIRAFNILKEKYDIKQDLVLVGRSGDDDCLINNEFKRSPFSGNIKIIGYVNDNEIKRIYKKSDVFVYPSLYEGFGIPVLEAMLTDVPVVTSGVSSLPEVGQDAVCYVDPYSDKDIADGIFRVLSDDDYRKKMIIKGREVSGRFTWVNTAKSTIKAFESVMGQ
jgi:glycosyltransferase involved in cell wall biosynthesis